MMVKKVTYLVELGYLNSSCLRKSMFTQEAALIFAQTESHKIALYQLVSESSQGVSETQWNVQKTQ